MPPMAMSQNTKASYGIANVLHTIGVALTAIGVAIALMEMRRRRSREKQQTNVAGAEHDDDGPLESTDAGMFFNAQRTSEVVDHMIQCLLKS